MSYLRTYSEIELGVGEEVVRTGADYEASTDARIGETEAGAGALGSVAHQLLEQFSLWRGVSIGGVGSEKRTCSAAILTAYAQCLDGERQWLNSL